MRVELPYGARAYATDLGGRRARVLEAGGLPAPRGVQELLADAIDYPTGTPLRVRPGDRITLIVSDATRHEPRAAFVRALRERCAGVRWTLAIATGTHGPSRIDQLGIPDELISDMTIVNHDGHRDDGLVVLGTTSRGTPAHVHRCLVDTDHVIATGCIRPHYFAGFGAGTKALFPGLGGAAAIRINHRLKTQPDSRAGIVVGNPCREDLEEVARFVTAPVFLVNAVVGPDDAIHAAVAGDPVDAFRAGVAIARPWFTVRATPAPLVIASDALPITASLYQAAKIAAASAPLVAPGGTLVLVAQCPDGIGPVEVVNEAIFRIGVLPRLPADAQLVLVSDLGEDATRKTLLTYAASVEAVLDRVPGEILILPRASHLIAEPSS